MLMHVIFISYNSHVRKPPQYQPSNKDRVKLDISAHIFNRAIILHPATEIEPNDSENDRESIDQDVPVHRYSVHDSRFGEEGHDKDETEVEDGEVVDGAAQLP